MKKNLLYVSCHQTMEYYNQIMFNELGFNVFTTGWYQDPQSPQNNHLPKTNLTVDPDLLALFKKDNPTYEYGYHIPLKLTKEFIEKFDVIIISWRYDYLRDHFSLLKDKLVIFETVGQSDANRERELRAVKNNGVKLVRVSETEKHFRDYAGADAFIHSCVDTDTFKGWNGNSDTVMTVNSSAKVRSIACNLSSYLSITSGLNGKLYGKNNQDWKHPFSQGEVEFDELLRNYQNCRVYFSLGSKPAPLTYTPFEAMSVGCPVVTWGPRLGGIPGQNTYATYKFIENGVNGFYSDNPKELREFILKLLSDYDLAKRISSKARETALKHFSKDAVKLKWKEFFEEISVL